MSRFSQSAMCSRPPRVVYSVVNDIESYPQFVPWCHHAEILSTEPGKIIASLSFRLGPKMLKFTTCNILQPHHQIQINLVDGPFRKLEGVWRFEEVGQGTRVVCDLEYEFSSARVGALFGLFLPRLLNHLIQRFIERAESHSPESDPSLSGQRNT